MNAPVKINAHRFARDEFDYYTEPAWVSERLFAVEKFRGPIVDPACGSGRIVRAARAAGYKAIGSDIVSRGPECLAINDYIEHPYKALNLVSNPPFRQAQRFAEMALAFTDRKVALLLPALWICGEKRTRWLEQTPLRKVLFITPRPSMPPGAMIEAGTVASGGKTDFAWFIWQADYEGPTEMGWLRRNP